MKYLLGEKRFKTWTEVHNYARELLKNERTLTDKDLKFALDLLEHHPRKDVKKALGVKGILVKVADIGEHNCFHIITNDDKLIDFSYKSCLASGKSKSTRKTSTKTWKENCRLRAYRYAIADQINMFRQTNECVCAQCGSKENPEVDHKDPQFSHLVNNFEQWYQPTEYPHINHIQDGSYYPYRFDFDNEFVTAWEYYHQEHANLQILCEKCNNKKPGRVKYKPYIEINR